VTDPGPAGTGAPRLRSWLRRLAAAAAVMEVPGSSGTPASGGRHSAVLVLFAEGADGPDLLYVQKNEGCAARRAARVSWRQDRRHRRQPGRHRAARGGRGDRPRSKRRRRARDAPRVVYHPQPVPRRPGARLVAVAVRRPPGGHRGDRGGVERISVADPRDPANRVMLRFPAGHSGPAFRIGSMLIWGFTGLITDRLPSHSAAGSVPGTTPSSGKCPRAPLSGTRRPQPGGAAIRDGALLLGNSGYRGHRAR